MEKDSLVNGKISLMIGLYLLVLALFMGKQTVVKAANVDIIGFGPNTACSGLGIACLNYTQSDCCVFAGPKGAIFFKNAKHCHSTAVYYGHGCDNQLSYQDTVKCFLGGPFTGGRWFNNCGKTDGTTTTTTLSVVSQNESRAAPNCTSTVAPNAIVYTMDMSKGALVLKTTDAENMLLQLQSVQDDQKVNWLNERGAYAISGDELVNMSPS